MPVTEQPFVSRAAIIAVLRPGQPSTEGPFRTLRHHGLASEGIRLNMRAQSGRVVGSTSLYSTLNTDAARAARLRRPEMAREFAVAAHGLEHSLAAEVIRSAIAKATSKVDRAPDQPASLHRYLRMRAGAGRLGDRDALVREWIVSSDSWLDRDETGDVRAAVLELARLAEEARTSISPNANEDATTFFGRVARLDRTAAEIDAEGGAVLVPRRDLEREGLASIGQAVALLCEVSPSGGTLTLPLPAVALDAPVRSSQPSPWDIPDFTEGSIPGLRMPGPDRRWLDRTLAEEPRAVPVSPIPHA